jgi:hypothetical protein
MPTNSSPPVGAIAFGRSGVGCIIEALEANRVILKTPNGLKRVPFDAIIRWELSAVPNEPTVGDRVKLKNTHLFYTLIDVFEVPYWINGDRTVELWARCQNIEGRIATWKLGQLETYSDCHSNKQQDL